MRKTYKLISIVIIAIMLVCTLSTTLFATMTPSQIEATKTGADDQIKDIGGKVFSAVRTAGVVLSVIMLAVLGVKYMMGSAEEKAEYKKSMLPYIIGAFLIFGASVIATMVYNLTNLQS